MMYVEVERDIYRVGNKWNDMIVYTLFRNRSAFICINFLLSCCNILFLWHISYPCPRVHSRRYPRAPVCTVFQSVEGKESAVLEDSTCPLLDTLPLWIALRVLGEKAYTYSLDTCVLFFLVCVCRTMCAFFSASVHGIDEASHLRGNYVLEILHLLLCLFRLGGCGSKHPPFHCPDSLLCWKAGHNLPIEARGED